MTPADLKREAKRRGILDKDDVAWFVENGEEVMLFEEALRSKALLEAGEFVVKGEPDHAAGWGTVLVWKGLFDSPRWFEEYFEEEWPTSEARRELLAAK